MHITDEIHPKELQKLLEKIAGSDEENLISRLTLRSMKKAKYTANVFDIRTCGKILLPFYFANKKISGFANS